MLELMQKLIAFKYACKINHWNTNNYSEHLLFDRLQENIDDIVDELAESYFMANKEAKKLNNELLNKSFVELNLKKSITDIIEITENILSKNEKKFTEGTKALLGDISSKFHGKLALINLMK